MGCDIHLVLERFDEKRNVWVGQEIAYISEENYYVNAYTRNPDGEDRRAPPNYYIQHKLRSRNYAFFNALCGVRGEGSPFGFEPRGLPDDASDMSLLVLPEDNMDLHSHSWLNLRDLSQALVYASSRDGDTDGEAVKGRMANDGYDPVLIGEFVDKWLEPENYEFTRLVFAFDN